MNSWDREIRALKDRLEGGVGYKVATGYESWSDDALEESAYHHEYEGVLIEEERQRRRQKRGGEMNPEAELSWVIGRLEALDRGTLLVSGSNDPVHGERAVLTRRRNKLSTLIAEAKVPRHDLARLIVWAHMKMRGAALVDGLEYIEDRSVPFKLFILAVNAAARIRGSQRLEDALPELWGNSSR